ncbi:sulfotransferase [Lacipirellula sp.]|uniref:sulfotransferase family protein n=1 Tax=Lacipirellula sp. TaxID=2691419 RepID=UPI003D0A1B66
MAPGRKKKPHGKKPASPRNARNGAADKSKQLEQLRRAQLGHAPDVRIDKAQAAWHARRYDEAIRLYERALESQPTNAVLLIDVSRAYALRFRHAEAQELVDRACRLHPNDARLQCMLGRTYVQLQHFEQAIGCFNRALELEPDSPERARTLYELAHMYERLHRLDEARAAAEASLALAPQQYVLRYLLAVVDRRQGNVESAQQRLNELLASNDRMTPELRADANYQLSLINDRQGDYDGAFVAAAEAKRILSSAAGDVRYDAADISAAGQRTYATVSAELFQRWNSATPQLASLPGRLAVLTGHPRSGTTLLEQVLDSHPGLISADEVPAMSETVYIPLCDGSPMTTPAPAIFDAKPNAEISARRLAYWQAMEGSLRQSIGDRMLLDKNPALTGLLPLIGRVFPDMRIVFALRDPRDVVMSCFLQQLPMNPVSIHYLTIEETAREYAATMRLWLKLRTMMTNPWIEVRYEDTVADMESQARRVLEFLELPWDDAVLNYRQRAQEKHVHSPTYEAVTKPLYTSSIGRWKNYAKQLEPCLSTLQPYIEAFGYEQAAS